MARDLGNVLVELSPDVIVVTEYECLLQLEADGDDVFGILLRKSVGLINFELVLEEELLVVWSSLVFIKCGEVIWLTRQLDDKRDIKDVL